MLITTSPGYTNRLAVTSIWHLLVQEIDGWRDDAGLEEITGGDDNAGGEETNGGEDDAGVGTSVWTTVVVLGTTCVMVKI